MFYYLIIISSVDNSNGTYIDNNDRPCYQKFKAIQ